MVGHGGSSAGSYLTDPTSPIPSHCASIVVTSTVRVNNMTPVWVNVAVSQVLIHMEGMDPCRSARQRYMFADRISS